MTAGHGLSGALHVGAGIGQAVIVGVAALALGSIFAIFLAPAPPGFKVAGWLFAAAIIAVSRYAPSKHPPAPLADRSRS
jgi:hypothetical protein